MKFSQGIFAIKLYELEQQYGHMQSRLRLCQQADQPKIRQELQRTEDEYRENELLLQENVKGSRSPAVAALAPSCTISRRSSGFWSRTCRITCTANPAPPQRTTQRRWRSTRNTQSITRPSPCAMR